MAIPTRDGVGLTNYNRQLSPIDSITPIVQPNSLPISIFWIRIPAALRCVKSTINNGRGKSTNRQMSITSESWVKVERLSLQMFAQVITTEPNRSEYKTPEKRCKIGRFDCEYRPK